MALVESEMMQLVQVGNVMVVMVEELLDKIDGFDTLINKLGDLKSPHCAIQNWDDPSTPSYRYWSRGFPLLGNSGQ